MAERLPFIRGEFERTEVFQDPRGGGSTPSLPSRDPAKHRKHVLDQLDQIQKQVTSRAAGLRDEEASREVIAVQPAPGADLATSSLASKKEDVRVIGGDPTTHTVLLDAASPELAELRRKVEAFGDESKQTDTGRPKNEPLVAPIDRIALATLDDLAREPLDLLRDLGAQWLELVCRGGVYDEAGTAASRRQVDRQVKVVDSERGIAAEFVSPAAVAFYVKLDLSQLEMLLDRVDCVIEVGLARKEIRDWLYLERDAESVPKNVTVEAPEADAPAIVLLDTGIADWHPLLAKAVRSLGSVVPGIDSGVDVDGHGSQMAGVALHLDVGDAIAQGSVRSPHWLRAVKIITDDSKSSDESARALWPPMTVKAVEGVADLDVGRQVYAMAVTAALDAVEPTTWSQAIDQLAWNDGKGRLLIVSMGNADPISAALLDGYPQLNLVQPMEDPAQAWNCLTVGASTHRATMPPDDVWKEYAAVGTPSGISPHTSSRPLDSARTPNKPEVVLEGGNVAFDGMLPDATVPTLSALTAGYLRERPLASLSGTSEATARASHLAATIWRSAPDLEPATVRGLIVHAASWSETMNQQFEGLDDRLRICGYGIPETDIAIECTRERATVIVEDALPSCVVTHVPKDPPPKRPSTPKTKERIQRVSKLFRLPVPEQLLLDNPDNLVELRITLSYFAEIHTFRRTSFRGLDLRWDMQGPQESEAAFRYRVNKLVREQSDEVTKGKSFDWAIGPQRRQRGTVQSDRWRGPASMLAGDKLIAIMPRLGWWNERVAFREKQLPFSLIVTVRAAGLDVYTPISVAVGSAVEVMV
jgi:hypothetical protein